MSVATPALSRSTVGTKVVMAVTGAVLVLFVIAHMVGNLKIFLGASSFDHYSEWLRSVGTPVLPHRGFLTILEVVLVICVVLHMWSAAALTMRARRARPVRYAVRRRNHAQGYAVRTLRFGGVVIALFVVWHLLDLTAGAVNPAGHDSSPSARVVAGFAPSRWYVTAFYTAAIVLLGLHLRHGIRSAAQTLGIVGPRTRVLYDRLAATVAIVLVAGFLAVPISVSFGWVALP